MHRDLKPENILVGEDLHLKLIDFGDAKEFENSIFAEDIAADTQKELNEGSHFDANLAENGFETNDFGGDRDRRDTFVGTPLYVSPEMLEHNKSLPSSDLWALGCIIYRMHVGDVPFTAAHESAVFTKILNRDCSFPEDMAPDTKDVIDKLLQIDPAKRIGAGKPGS